MKNRINEKDTAKLFEEFYIKALTNDPKLAEFFDLRIRELDNEVKAVSEKLKEVVVKTNSEYNDVYKLNDAFKDLGIEINNISLSLKSLLNSNRNSFLTKEQAKLENDDLKVDYEVKIKDSEKRLTKALFVNLLKNFEQKILEEDKALLKKRFYPLIEIIRKDIIDEELNQRGQFRVLLEQATEQYSEVNKKVTFLSDMIDRMRSHEEEVLSEERLRHYVGEMKKEIEQYSNILYGKIAKELDSLSEDSYSSIEEIQGQYQEIIAILRGEIDEVDKEGAVKAFRPLITELIDIELYQRGRFVEFLSQSIDKLSKEKDEELQNTFQQIVTTIVGEGTKQNQRMARQNTEIGLRKMSEADVDDLLGRKIASIVDKRSSSFGDAINNLTDNLKKITVLNAANPQQQIAQKFFDGLSFSIYYYKFTIDKNIKITDETLLPEEVKISDFDCIGEFEKVINAFEDNIAQMDSQRAEKYKRYKKAEMRQFADSNSMLTLDVYCYFRYYDGQKAYFFLNQEPSTFFKRELDHILTSNKDIKASAKKIEELVKNYSIPKVQVAVFNKENFDLPSEGDECSVISTKTGDKALEPEEEEELSNILEKVETHHAKRDSQKSIFSFWGKKNSNEHHDKDGLWHFWSVKLPTGEKYLAVKMVKSFDNTENEQMFVKHVSENVWDGLQKSKNTGEMQDWVDSFTQKDSSILNADGMLIRLIKFASKNGLALSILGLLMATAYWVWIDQSRLQNELLPNINQEIEETQERLSSKVDEQVAATQVEFKTEIEKTDRDIQQQIASFSKLLQLNTYSSQPFIFKEGDYTITGLHYFDLDRLKQIKNIIDAVIQDNQHVMLLLIPHRNPDKASKYRPFNPNRAQAIKTYLIEGFNESDKSKMTINIEEDEENFLPDAYGVSIRLLSIDK